MRILVVDDNQAVLNQLSGLLSARYEVVEAANGLDAQEKLQSQQFDLLVVDHLMPLMNGIQLLKNLQQHAQGRAMPSIFMTTQGSTKVKELVEQGLCDCIVDKPLDETKLLSLIQQLNKQNTVCHSL